MAYTEKYNVLFRSILDKDYEFKILEKDYSGASTELVGTVEPCVRYIKGDSDEIEDRIMRSECTVRVNSITDYALMGLFTYDSKQFKGELYKESVLYWQGFLTPDYYTEPYVPAPYEVELLFTDGLGLLKGKDYDYHDYLYGLTQQYKVSIWDAFRRCIGMTDNVLSYSEGIYIYEENHNQSDANSMMNQTYFDSRIFKGMNYYDALDEILKACGNARLWQQDGRWFVVSPNAMKADYVVRKYSAAGVYDTTETISPVITLTDGYQSDANINVLLDSPTLSIRPAWKKFQLEQDFGYRENILDLHNYSVVGTVDADVDGYYATSSPSPGYRGMLDEDYVLKIECEDDPISTSDYLQFDLGTVENSTRYYLYLKFNPKTWPDTAIKLKLYIFSGGTYRYMKSDGDWTATNSYCYDGNYNSETPIEISSDEISIAGTLRLQIFNPWISGTRRGAGDLAIISFRTEDDFIIKLEGYIKIYESVTIETEINDEQNYVPDKYTMKLGDMPDVDNNSIMYLGGLYRYSSGYIPTEYWNIKGSTDLKHLVNLIADEISVNHVRPMAMISGALRCNFKPGTIVKTSLSDNRLFMIIRANEDMYDDEWDVDIVEFSYADQGYLKLRSGGYITLRGGGKIKLRN